MTKYWGQETPEPNLYSNPDDYPNSVPGARRRRGAHASPALTVQISKIIEAREKSKCDSASTSEANLN